MSIWMLVVFAVCMAAAALAFGPVGGSVGYAILVFLLTLIVFMAGLLIQGIRKPVV